MNPEDVDIKGEYVIRFKDCGNDDETMYKRWRELLQKISEAASQHGFKWVEWGTEQQVRLSLIERASAIASGEYDWVDEEEE